MELKINKWILLGFIVGVVILIITLIRGCNQSNLRLQAQQKLQNANDSIKAAANVIHFNDSVDKKSFQDSIEFIKGQYALIQNQKARVENDLDNMQVENKKLIAKYRANNYVDTSTMVVSNEFVDDCHNCFDRLETQTFIVDKYKLLVKKSDSLSIVKDSRFQKRISQQEKEKDSLNALLNYCLDINKEAQNKLKPKGTLYFSWGVQFKPLPKMAAVGLMYQAKNRVIYGAKGWFGQYGSMVEANFNLPISSKRRR